MNHEVWPRGYDLDYTGVITGIIIYIGLFVFALTSGITHNPKDFSEFVKFASAVALFNSILLCFGLYKLTQSYKRRRERKWMMEHADFATEGKVLEVKEQLIDYKGNIVTGSYLDHAECHIGYRLIVSYIHPVDGTEKVVESDIYMKNPKGFLEYAEIKVYLGKNAPLLIAVFPQ